MKSFRPFKYFNYWQKVLSKIKTEQVSVGAAALAYYLSTATLPAIFCLLGVLPFLPFEGTGDFLLDTLRTQLPGEIGHQIVNIISEIIKEKKPGLLTLGFLAALWATSSGMMAIIQQLNYAYNTTKKRGWLSKRLKGVSLTLLFGAVVTISCIAQIYINTQNEYLILILNFNNLLTTIINYLFTFVFIIFLFASLYYLAPAGKRKFKYITPGSIIGTLLFVLVTISFDFYISNFAVYNKTYGSAGGVVAYMLWLYLSGYVLLLGAEINGVIEAVSKKTKR